MNAYPQKPETEVLKLEYNVWFGKIADAEVKISEDLEKSFLSSSNSAPLPFSVYDRGKEIFGDDYYRILRKVAIKIAQKAVESEIRREDRYVISLVRALDEITDTSNLLDERLRELKEIKESLIVETFEKRLMEFKTLKGDIEGEIEEVMRKIAPNVSDIVGEKIGARLLEKAGSLEKLASYPSSTIQVIGAEKSLFKALSRMRKGKKAKVPKHGVIFQHPYIKSLPKKKRGKMARFVANKIAIGAKIDYFRGELNESLGEEVRRKYEQLSRN